MKNSRTMPNRAGRYIKQPDGYKAFIPAPLPPKHPPVEITGELLEQLSLAERALGQLDGSIRTLPNPDMFVYMYMRKEAVLSSQIEGTQSSLVDLIQAESMGINSHRLGDTGEVINYVRAMNYGLSRLQNLPVSVPLIQEIHKELLHGVRGGDLTPGELRNEQNWIGAPGCSVHEAVFVPPPAHQVREDISNLETFIQSDIQLPLLIKIGLAHAQFETIHPFLDGNGRVGRLLITFLLCERNALQKQVLYLSYFFKKHQQQYYHELQSVRDAGTWEEWLLFFLRGITEVGSQAANTAQRIMNLRERHRQEITENFGRAAGSGHRVLEHLYEFPIVSVNDVQNVIEMSYTAANNLVKRMVQSRILNDFNEQARNRRFWYMDYILLFHDEES